jgi:hypothetical protein
MIIMMMTKKMEFKERVAISMVFKPAVREEIEMKNVESILSTKERSLIVVDDSVNQRINPPPIMRIRVQMAAIFV